MKKAISFLFLFVMVLGITACSNSRQTDETTQKQGSQTQVE